MPESRTQQKKRNKNKRPVSRAPSAHTHHTSHHRMKRLDCVAVVKNWHLPAKVKRSFIADGTYIQRLSHSFYDLLGFWRRMWLQQRLAFAMSRRIEWCSAWNWVELKQNRNFFCQLQMDLSFLTGRNSREKNTHKKLKNFAQGKNHMKK